jgi:hypothetical protein
VDWALHQPIWPGKGATGIHWSPLESTWITWGRVKTSHQVITLNFESVRKFLILPKFFLPTTSTRSAIHKLTKGLLPPVMSGLLPSCNERPPPSCDGRLPPSCDEHPPPSCDECPLLRRTPSPEMNTLSCNEHPPPSLDGQPCLSTNGLFLLDERSPCSMNERSLPLYLRLAGLRPPPYIDKGSPRPPPYLDKWSPLSFDK